MSTIIKESVITSKGQVTIPIEWRRRFADVKKIVWKENRSGDLLVEPADDADNDGWITLFDFTDEGGIPADEVNKAIAEVKKMKYGK